MRTPSVSDTELIDALAEVISRYGFEGASLTRLSDASGLRRASLYHRFPGGKDEILDMAIARVGDRFGELLAPAYEAGAPRDRAERVALGIDEYYAGGERSCLIVALSLADKDVRDDVEPCLVRWIEAFTTLATAGGMSSVDAHEVAVEQVALLEGSLVVAQVTGETEPFRRAIRRLPDRLVPEA
jgi:TetR/AcrR family transcriptional regulator, lmrAB and yxaGH operons repressor